MSTSVRSIIEEAPDSPAIKERHEERLRRLNIRQIPRLRLAGFALLALGVLVHNLAFDGRVDAGAFSTYLLVTMAYALASWFVLDRFYAPSGRVDLAFVFLVVDLAFFSYAVYVAGAERSLLFFALAVRAADQSNAGFRRALVFAHLATLAYVLMLLVVVFVDGRPISWGQGFAVTLFLWGACFYVALTGRPFDRLRRRNAEAIAFARELVARLKGQSVELDQARVRAEAASEAKSRFLANVSHELRTPMNAVLGTLQLLARDRLEPDQRQLVQAAQKGAGELLAVLDDILDFSALEASGAAAECDIEPTEPRQVVASALARVADEAAAKGLSLTAEIAPAVPLRLMLDAYRLRQVLHKLLANAVKFTESGGITVLVQAGGPPSGSPLRIGVRDTGIGISPEARERIFSPFAQEDPSPARRHGGAGLGLAICRGHVEAMGGEMRVESSPGAGSTFWVSFPALEPPTLLEPETLDRLRALGARRGRNLLAEMAVIFLREGPARLERLEAALARGDAQELAFVAHSLKGSSDTLGARKLAAACQSLETMAREGDLFAASPLVALVVAAYREVERELRELEGVKGAA